jgi:antimicrobial peptide system SdpA family protein
MTEECRPMTDRRLGQIVVGLGVVAVVVVALAVYAAVPPTAVQLPRQVTTAGQLLFPQGWAFFTANPQDVYPQAYERSDGVWVNRGGSLAVPSDLFGLDRSVRATSTEIALLLQHVSVKSWRTCAGLPTTCLSAAPVSVHLVNTSTLDNLCGDVGLVQQEVLP